jgi:hypothetical protein
MDTDYLMLKEVIAAIPTSGAQEDHHPLLEYLPTDNHSFSNALHSSHPLILSSVMPARLYQEIETMHIQEPANCSGGPLVEAQALIALLYYHHLINILPQMQPFF